MYKKLLSRCRMHGHDQITQMDIFYHAMNYTSKGIIDIACCGAFKRNSAKEANQLIEYLSKSNYRALSKTLGSNSRLRLSGVIELNKMSAIEAKLDELMNKVSMQERRNQSAHLMGTVEDEQRFLNDEGLAHDDHYDVEEVHYVNGNRSYNFKPTQIFQPTTHQLQGTMRISHMDLQYSKDKDLCRIINNSMVNLVSKDSSNKTTRELRIRAKEGPILLRTNVEIGENKNLLNIHEQKFVELAVF